MGDFVSGAYTATYNAKALGQTAQGFFLSHEFFKRMVMGDLFGDAPQDAIYRGRAQFVEYELIEALKAAVADLTDPYATSLGTLLTTGILGQLDVGSTTCPGKVKPLVLTAVASTCAAAFGPVTVTLPLSILAEGYPVRVLYGPDLRTVPIRQRIYPGSGGVFGTVA